MDDRNHEFPDDGSVAFGHPLTVWKAGIVIVNDGAPFMHAVDPHASFGNAVVTVLLFDGAHILERVR